MKILVGDPVVRGALALFPLTTTEVSAPPYVPGPVAEATHALVVHECDDAAVPELLVENLGDAPLLLVEGETLLGAKQNRTLNLSVLCAAGIGTAVPVSCVEAGRWGPPQASRRSSRHAPPDMRRGKVASTLATTAQGYGLRSDQEQVWADVDAYAYALEAPSVTGALEDIFDAAEAQTRPLVADLEPGPDQQGVLVAISGQICGLDLFDKPSTLAAYWPGLLAGYALDAVGQSEGPVEFSAASDFAERVGGASIVWFDAPGLGEAGRLVVAGAIGAIRSWEGAVVHVAAFIDDQALSSRPIRRYARPESGS